MNKRAKSILFFSLIALALISILAYFVSAVDFTATVNPSTAVYSGSATVFNFTITNLNITANITQINITQSFGGGAVGSGSSRDALIQTGASFASFTNDTSQLVINGTMAYFWFPVAAYSPGHFNFTVIALDEAGIVNTIDNVSVTVNDMASPSVTLLTPPDGINSSLVSIAFNCTATDNFQLANITLSIWNSSNYLWEFTNAVSGAANNSYQSTDFFKNETYKWNCKVGDSSSNYAFASANRTFTIDQVKPAIISASTLEPDIFYSTFDKYVNISVNISDLTALTVKANFSSLAGVTCANGDATVNLTLSGGLYSGSCDISAGVNSTQPSPRQITISAFDSALPMPNQNGTALTILVHNMGIPGPEGGAGMGCNRFGNLTTNFTEVLNFSAVNFIIQMEFNGSCLTGPGGGTSPWTGFQQVMMMNFSSLNMANQSIGQKLAALNTALQVNITPPHEFGVTRIYVNETAFAELNTNTTITLNNLPFASFPNIVPDNASRPASNIVFINETPFYFQIPGGQNITVPRGTIRFSVTGFSGYNATDNVNPSININAPTTNISAPVVLVNVRVNGTGTEPNQINIDFAGTTYYYNTTGNSAGCSNISADKETFDCIIGPAPVSDSQYTITVNAWDYGGSAAPGNTNSSSFTFIKDTTAPIFVSEPSASIPSGSAYSQSVFYQFNYTVTDGSGVGIQKVIMTFNGTNYTMSSAGSDIYTNNSIKNLSAGTYSYIFWANDTLGNNQFSDAYLYSVSQATPTLTLTNYSALSVTYGTAINATGSGCPSQLTCTLYNNNAALGSASDKGAYQAGDYTYVYNTTGNTNYSSGSSSSLAFTINKAAGNVTLSINGSRSNIAISNATQILLNATLVSGTGNIQLYNNETLIYNGTSPYAGNLTNFTTTSANEVFNITAIYYGNINYSAISESFYVNVYNPSAGELGDSKNEALNENQTVLVVINSSVIANVTFNAPSNQTAFIDFSTATSFIGNNLTIGADPLILKRNDTNYTVILAANTNISGVGWNGKLTAPTTNLSSFTAPSGSTNLVIDSGSSSGLNLSNPAKVILVGQAGKRAAWSRGSTTLTAISTQCDNVTLPTNINATISPRECYADSGSDLIIWTYHFTSFAAYTPSTTTPPGGTTNTGGGACYNEWKCTAWSECVLGQQVRICTKLNEFCPLVASKPAEEQSCTVTPTTQPETQPEVNPTIPTTPTTQPETVPTAVTKTKVVPMIIAAIVLISAVGYIAMQMIKKKKLHHIAHHHEVHHAHHPEHPLHHGLKHHAAHQSSEHLKK